MENVKNLVANEPVLVTGLIEALIVLAVAFGFDLTPDQIGAILSAVAIATAVLARMFVTPVAPSERGF